MQKERLLSEGQSRQSRQLPRSPGYYYIMFRHRDMTLLRVPESDMMTAQIIRHKSHDLRQGGPTVPKLLDPKSNHCHRRS